MTSRDAKKKTLANRDEALLGYRRSAKGLFDESKILDLKHEDEKTNCDRILRRFADVTKLFKDFRVRVDPFDEEEMEQIAAALTMPTLATYTEWTPTDPSDPDSPAKPYEREFNPPECGKIAALQKAARMYCFEAADLAHRTKSATESDWKWAFNTIDRECMSGCVTFPACPSSDAARIVRLINEGANALRADILVLCRDLKRDIDAHIASIEGKMEQSLRKIRGETDSTRIAAAVADCASSTFGEMAELTKCAIDYGFYDDNDGIDTYDASGIGEKLSEMARLRFAEDTTVMNACLSAIEAFMYEFDDTCQVYRGSLIQGVTENYLEIYEWLTRKDPPAASPRPKRSAEKRLPDDTPDTSGIQPGDWARNVLHDFNGTTRTLVFKGNKGGAGEVLVCPPDATEPWKHLRGMIESTDPKGWYDVPKINRKGFNQQFQRSDKDKKTGKWTANNLELRKIYAHVAKNPKNRKNHKLEVRLTRRSERAIVKKAKSDKKASSSKPVKASKLTF